MKKTAYRLAASVLFVSVGAMFFGAPSAIASDNHCVNKCNQAYRSCVNQATNPGALNQCGKTLQRCLATCN